MVLLNDSLTIVLVGDWNKLYIQPDWMAKHVFESEEVEIGINGQGSDFTVVYRSNGVIISPDQSKLVFSVINTDNDTINDLCRFLNNFLEKAHTPQLFAYGMNIDFVEEDGSLFAEVLDSMSDTNAIIECGYEIVSTQISRTLKNAERVLNMDSHLENSKLKIHFNEHHASEESRPRFTIESLKGFLERCKQILQGLGYELEGDELC